MSFSQDQGKQTNWLNVDKKENGYQLMPIDPLLRPYIESIEIELLHSQVVQPISPYRIYPSASVVIGFQYKGELDFLTRDGSKIRLQRSGMTGILESYRDFQPTASNIKSILVRLYPWSIPLLLGEPAFLFTDQSLGLVDIVKSQIIQEVEEKIQGTEDIQRLSTIIQEFFIQLYALNSTKKLSQPHIIHMAQNLSANPTINSFESFANYYGYSKRSLERHFQASIGMSPKKFIMIARFQKILNMIKNGYAWDNIAESFDYYDQSHFIKNIKQFTGLTPTQLSQLYISP